MRNQEYLHCSNCADVRLVETPMCADGHGRDCPERACTECGSALFLDPLTTHGRRPPAARRAA